MTDKPENLRCEGLPEPLGIGTSVPRLSWELPIGRRGAAMTGMSILVWDNAEGTVWESTCTDCPVPEALYAGTPLRPHHSYGWKVKVLFADGREGEWSDPAHFECGCFSISDWSGSWTAYPANLKYHKNLTVVHLRQEFSLRQDAIPVRARALVAATGPHPAVGNDAMRMNLYQLWLNGRKAGDDLINPGQLAVQSGRALYRVFDVLPLLEQHNAVGIIHAAGKISIQIFIDYANGESEQAVDGSRWRRKTGGGPYRRLWKHDIKEYGGRGEFYDAGSELPGWARPGYADSDWQKAFPCAPPGLLAPQTFAVTIDQTVSPASVKTFPDGSTVIDFGRNMNGIFALDTRGKPGDAVRMRFAELLDASGRIDCSSTSPLAEFDQEDIYIRKSGEKETYMPAFATHAFRYAEITGMSGRPEAGDMRALSIAADLPNRSSFRSSSDALDRLDRLCADTMRANMVSVPTDCPGRERNGWLADAWTVCDAEFLNFDAVHLYRKWFADIGDMQEPDGCLPYVCPFAYPPEGKDIIWAACFTLMVWDAYRNSGDRRLLEENYPVMLKLGRYLAGLLRSGAAISDFVLFNGDHAARERPSAEYLGRVYCAANLDRLATICGLLGKSSDESFFRQQSLRIAGAVHRDYHRPDGGYDNGSQSADAHALCFGIAPVSCRPAVLSRLTETLEKNPGFTAGMLGTHALLQVLTENGRDDLVWKVVGSEEPGTWGYWQKHGPADTAPEHWIPEEHPGCSRNHPMLIGGIASWLYRGLGGIRILEPGYRKVEFRPYFPPDLTELAVKVDSPYGVISSAWARTGDRAALAVSLPPGCRGTLRLPCPEAVGIHYDPDRVTVPDGESSGSVFQLESGHYDFRFQVCP